MIRRIALMRAEDDSEATAAELAARGFEAVIAPAIEIRALPAAPPEGRFDALVATSPRAIHALGEADRARLATIPLHVVGARAARAARDAGLALAGEPAADAAALAERLARTLPPGARLLYLAGRDRKPTLEAALAAAGLAVEAVELYAAEAREAWSAREAAGGRRLRRRAALFAPHRRARRRAGGAGGARRTLPRAAPRLPLGRRRRAARRRRRGANRRRRRRPTRRISWRRWSARSALRPKAEAGAAGRDAAPVSNRGRLAYRVARSDSEGPWPRIRSRAPNRRSARRRRPPRRVLLGPIRG